jgi:HEAT repeat protein
MERSTSALPPVYALLARSNNVAADRALVTALPELPSDHWEAVLDLLIERDRPVGRMGLVSRFAAYPLDLQAAVASRADRLSAGIRQAIESAQPNARQAAISLVARSGRSRLAYLLASVLAQACPRSRDHAAGTLLKLVDRYFRHRGRPDADPSNPSRPQQARDLAAAIEQALACWDAHFRTEVITLAMWMAGPLEPAILARLADPRARLLHPFNELLTRDPDPRKAAYLLLALRCPGLHARAARWIANCRHNVVMVALLDEMWRLADPEVARALSWVQRLAWLEEGIDPLLGLDQKRAEAAAAFIAATGLPNEQKVNLLAQMAASEQSHLATAALWKLVENLTPPATNALRCLVKRGRESLACVAARELHRRGRAGLAPPTSPGAAEADLRQPNLVSFDAYWAVFDDLDRDRQVELGQYIRASLPDFNRHLRARLASGDPADRLRAAMIVRTLKLHAQEDTRLYRLAHDPDPMVRGAAIAALQGLDTRVARRILRQAMHDPDCRVQANAVEALDVLEAGPDGREFRAKMDSADNRIKANAILALLKLEVAEAVDALIAMLDHESRRHRLSALWVIECLQLKSVADRLIRMARGDPDPHVRSKATTVLETIAPRAVIAGRRM